MAAALAAAALLAGCAGEEPTARGEEETRLVVRELEGARLVDETVLDCAAGDDRCARVVSLLPSLRPDPEEVCTQVYGGPARLVVEGEVRGAPVRREITRRDGCEIARFDLLKEALAG